MAASSSSVVPTPLAHADNRGEGQPRGRPPLQPDLIFGSIPPLAADEACPLCGHTRMYGDHLLRCTGLDEYPTDNVFSRY
ncbi:hypothetical protein TNCV_4122981 [Trichonephila clavipes]|nr:hypothetical protein TNCV_4122981 [Trichonephila clavipes]